MKVPLSLAIVLLLLSGCNAGSGEGLDEQGRPLDEITEVPLVDDGIQATLLSIQEHVFTPICSVCHGGANPAAGQDLSSLESSIDNLINVDSSNSLFKRVLPGSAQESYLYLKITGDNRAGARMPLGQPALDEQTISAIKQWIDEGAVIPQNTANMAKINRAVVTMVTFKENVSEENVADLISKNDYIWREKNAITIVFWFNKAMNFANLTNDQILVNSFKGSLSSDYSTLVSNEQISINVINDQSIQVSVQGLDRDIIKLIIRLNESSIATMVTQQGQIIDGDNNGIEGGVFYYEFYL
ncbi:MAG: hypothetical protein HRT53_11315 [Colwellia sp.]|nr:hypothetical protein [Colwellia sp.]